jgi:SAM-dependent methyltransferase
VIPDFSRLTWSDGGFSIGRWPFRFHPEEHSGVPLDADDWLWIYKPRSMIEDYREVFAQRDPFSFDRAVELGIWGGGSVALWSLVADPSCLLAIDLSDQGDSAMLAQLRAERPSLHTAWSTDQADREAITARLADVGIDVLDVVIDDASHQYRASLGSFEILFPYLRPGGLYILEDWQWSFEPGGGQMASTQRPLVELLHELLGVLGSTTGVITRVEVYPLFAVIERGGAPISEPLQLQEQIRRRPRPTLASRAQQVRGKMRRELGHLAASTRRLVSDRG